MQITDNQQKLLDSLVCERLSSNAENLCLVENFCNKKNDRLEYILKGEACEEDEIGNVAYYLIKNKEGLILFYFSLKCGMLYDKYSEGEKLHKLYELSHYFSDLLQDSSLEETDRKTIESLLENMRIGQGLIKNDLARIPSTKKNQLIKDLEKETEDNLKRVGKTFAGVEIVHFCANDDAKCRHYWENSGIGQKLGAVVFWHFIVPKICNLRKIVGCEYVFLFAADKTPDEFLVNYYRTNLQFKYSDEHRTAIPLFDYGCKFMYQELSDIEDRRDSFYEDFNPDEEAI